MTLKIKILMVEDKPVVLQSFQVMLKKSIEEETIQPCIDTVNTVQEALDFIKLNQVDAINMVR